MKLTFPVSGAWTKDALDFRFTIDAPIMTTRVFTGCGKSKTSQFEVRAATFGGNTLASGGPDWHANWDGQAYTADDRSNAGGTEWHWTIHLEPPAPAVGLDPCQALNEERDRIRNDVRTRLQPAYNELNSVEKEKEMADRKLIIAEQKAKIKEINRKKRGVYKNEVKLLQESIDTSSAVIKKHAADRKAAVKRIEEAADRSDQIRKELSKKKCP